MGDLADVWRRKTEQQFDHVFPHAHRRADDGLQAVEARGVDSPGGTAVLMRMPLFGLLMALGMRSFNAQWSREYGVEVGLLGPTDECLQRLRERELPIPPS